ncbi:hypothetical protein DPX16_0682 [Anabarilius grahami]|uniref:Uncharacterized protein n=1 Tax=Anabarilius grahami TaxID=495550 RepID=A0A3N0Y0S9_ANAGA|nr:hypothetical protein DPX16_0682 [Anabarilius grahami]
MQHVQQAKIPAATLTDFHVRCQNFLRVACGGIKKRFEFDDALLTQITCLSPATATDAKARAEHPSLLPLMQQVPRLIDMADADRLQAIDDQWRRLPLLALSEDTKAMDVDEFWHHISTLEDFEGVTVLLPVSILKLFHAPPLHKWQFQVRNIGTLPLRHPLLIITFTTTTVNASQGPWSTAATIFVGR